MPLAVVTGAGSGIGAAVSYALAARGFDLALVGRSQRVDATRDAIQQQAPGIQAVSEQGDLADSRQRLDVMQRIRKVASARGEPVGALVHAAGVGAPSANLATWEPAELEHAFAVNVTAALALTQGLLPVLESGTTLGRVLLIGAGIDDKPQPGTGSYGISKLALKRLWHQMQLDLAHEAVSNAPRIGLFQPGVVDTPGLRAHIEAASDCGLPHASYLQSTLDAGHAYSAETVGNAIAALLVHIGSDAFAEHEWRTHELTPSGAG